MAIFDFKCPVCGRVEEHFINFKAEDFKWPCCKECLVNMEKQVSAPHFKFKGVNTGVDNPSSFKTKRHEECRLPINIIDQMPDGSIRVSSTAKDPEIINE